MATTQNKNILAYLMAGNEITPLVALNNFGCFRLASRIAELRKAGHDIGSRWTESINYRGETKRCKAYFINAHTI